jgi:hypothetical protein
VALGSRGALGYQRGGDLGDRMALGAQREHPVADPASLTRAFRSGLGGREELHPSRPQQGGHLMHAGGGVAEPVGYLDRGRLLDEVGTHRLVATLRGVCRPGEVLRTRPHLNTSS